MNGRFASLSTLARTVVVTALGAAALALQAPAWALTPLSASAAAADAFPGTLKFGDVATGRVGSAQQVSLRNTGAAPMAIGSIEAAGGDFGVVHDCPLGDAGLAPGRFCTLGVRFAPASLGEQSAVVQVRDTAGDLVVEILVQGNGVSAAPKLYANSPVLNFPDTEIYSFSGPLTVFFTNETGNDVHLDYYNLYPVEGEFTTYPPYYLVNGGLAGDAKRAVPAKVATPKGMLYRCEDLMYYYYSGLFLAPGDSCAAIFYFAPYSLGPKYGTYTLYWYDSSEASGQITIQLFGNGAPMPTPGLSLSASELDFGGVVVGGSGARTLIASSTGTSPVGISGVRTSGGVFDATSDCPLSLAPSTACTVFITCKPTALGLFTGDLYIDTDLDSGFVHVPLLCTGSEFPLPKIEVVTRGVSFGTQSLGSPSQPQPVEIRSVGSAPLSLSSITTGVPFDVGGNCPTALAPGASCNAQVTFTPTAGGRQRGVLAITSNDPDHPMETVDLNGTGCRPFSVQAGRRGANLCGP